jgi:hypothetical protein
MKSIVAVPAGLLLSVLSVLPAFAGTVGVTNFTEVKCIKGHSSSITNINYSEHGTKLNVVGAIKIEGGSVSGVDGSYVAGAGGASIEKSTFKMNQHTLAKAHDSYIGKSVSHTISAFSE